jgi:hypothetical protein
MLRGLQRGLWVSVIATLTLLMVGLATGLNARGVASATTVISAPLKLEGGVGAERGTFARLPATGVLAVGLCAVTPTKVTATLLSSSTAGV